MQTSIARRVKNRLVFNEQKHGLQMRQRKSEQKRRKSRQDGHEAPEQRQETRDGVDFLMVYAVGSFIVCTPLIFCYAGRACFILQWTLFISSLNYLVFGHHLRRQKRNKRRLHGKENRNAVVDRKKENKHAVVRSLALANLCLFVYFCFFFIMGRLIKYVLDSPEIPSMLFVWNGIVQELADILTLVTSTACPTYGTRNNYPPPFIISDPSRWPD